MKKIYYAHYYLTIYISTKVLFVNSLLFNFKRLAECARIPKIVILICFRALETTVEMLLTTSEIKGFVRGLQSSEHVLVHRKW